MSLRRIGGGGTDGDAAGRERRPSDARSCGGVSSRWSLISSARNHKLWPFAKRTWYGRILGSFRSSVMSTPVCPTNSRVDWFNGSPLALTTMTVSPTLARRRRDDTFGGVDSNAAAFNFPQCGPAFGAAFGCAPSARKFICTQLHPGRAPSVRPRRQREIYFQLRDGLHAATRRVLSFLTVHCTGPVETCTNWARLLVQVRYDTLFRVLSFAGSVFVTDIFVHDLAAWPLGHPTKTRITTSQQFFSADPRRCRLA